MASTYAAVSATGTIQALMSIVPQSNNAVSSSGSAPSQAELNTDVIAPSTFGWVYTNGSYVVAPANNPSLDYNAPLEQLQASGPNLSAPGHWNMFLPPSSPLIGQILNFPAGSGGIISGH